MSWSALPNINGLGRGCAIPVNSAPITGQLRADQWFSLPMTRHRDSFAHLVARQLASAKLDGVLVMTIDSLTAQKRLIEADIGIALLPESSIQEEFRLGTLRTIDISDLQTTVPIHVLYRKSGYLTGASRTLLSLIEPLCQYQLEENGWNVRACWPTATTKFFRLVDSASVG